MQTRADDVSLESGYQVQNRGTTLVITCVLFIVLDTALVGLRHYARRHLKSMPFALDDFLVLLAWLAHIGVCIALISQYPFLISSKVHDTHKATGEDRTIDSVFFSERNEGESIML